jgi:hypothetical protein
LITILTGLFGNYLQAQTCENCLLLTKNIHFEIDENLDFPLPSESSFKTFQLDYVPYWGATHGTPHHIRYIEGVSCSGFTELNGTEVMCIWASDTVRSEGVFQNLNTLSNDPYVQYCLQLKSQRIRCPWFLLEDYDWDFHLKIAIGKNFTNAPVEDYPMFLPDNPRQDIETVVINTLNEIPTEVQFSVTGASDFNQILFWVEGFEEGGDGYLELRDVELSCITSALTDISTTDLGPEEYRFTAINSSISSYFVDFFWDFGDNNSSTDETPVHQYSQPGNYEVCLNVIDNNGCCGTFCTNVQTNEASCDNPGPGIEITSTTGSTNLSDLINNEDLPYTQIGNLYLIENIDVILNTDLHIDVPAKFERVNWLIGANRNIFVESNTEFLRCEFNACDYLWRGITVSDGILINMTRSIIRDAIAAVNLLPQSSWIFSRFNLYENNITGISLGGNFFQSSNSLNLIQNDTFRTVATLKPQYNLPSWQTQQDFGLAGIFGYRISTFGARNCTFENLRYGVYSWSSTLRLIANHFIDKKDLDEDLKHGVYILEPGPISTMTQNNKFTNLPIGVHLFANNRASELRIHNSLFENSEGEDFINSSNFTIQQVLVEKANLSLIDVTGNTFDLNNTLGHSFRLHSGVKELNISNENIFNKFLGGFLSININNSLTGQKNIKGNKFNISEENDDTFFNIFLQNASNIVFEHNELKFTQLLNGGPNYSPIRLQYVNKSMFSFNYFDGHDRLFEVFNSGVDGLNNYCCNESNEDGDYNYVFEDESWSTLYGNEISGIRLRPSAFIGPQLSNGNIFMAETSVAFMENGNNQRAFLNRFHVDPHQIGNKPEFIIPTDPEFQSRWFREVGSPANCLDPQCDDGPRNNDPEHDPEDPDYEPDPCEKACEIYRVYQEMIEDTLMLWPDQRTWAAAVNILRNCPELISGGYCDEDTTIYIDPVITTWVDVLDDIIHVTVPDSTEIEPIILLQEELDSLFVIYDSLLTETNILAQDSTLLQCSNQIAILSDSIITLSDTIHSVIIQNAYQLWSELDNLPTPYSFLALRKQVWIAEIKYLIYGDSSISTADRDSLEVIALLCPSEMGPVVFEARSLLEKLGTSILDDPYENCGDRTLEPRIRKEEIADVEMAKVYPNPNMGDFIIEFSYEVMDPKVRIYDITGKMIFDNNFMGQISQIYIDNMETKPGIYFYEIFSVDKAIAKGKILIIQ